MPLLRHPANLRYGWRLARDRSVQWDDRGMTAQFEPLAPAGLSRPAFPKGTAGFVI
jgi:hypothetical protein